MLSIATDRQTGTNINVAFWRFCPDTDDALVAHNNVPEHYAGRSAASYEYVLPALAPKSVALD